MTQKTNHPVIAEISKDGERVDVHFDYNPDFVIKVKRVPTAKPNTPKRREAGAPFWCVNLDLATCRRLREEFGDKLGLGEKLKAWGQEEVAKEKALKDLSQAEDADLENINKELSEWLRPYQRADVRFQAQTNALNTNQPRTGKTPTTIGALIEAGMEDGQHLVLAPKLSLRNTWERIIKEMYAKAGLEEPTVYTGDSPKLRRQAAKDAAGAAKRGEAFWLVLNPAMARLKRTRHGKGDDAYFTEDPATPELLEVEWDSITIDEFHLMGLSNPATLGSRGVMMIAEATQPSRRYALSGTPMGGKPIKLWGALRFLEPDKFTSRWNWARHWLVINHNGYGSKIEGITPGREADFYDHLKPYLVRRTTREALPGLPKRNVEDIWVGMTPKQAEQYRMFEQDAEWRLEEAEEEGRLTATNILAEYTRLKQFAGAFCKVYRKGDDKMQVTATPDSGKLDALLEKLAELDVTDPNENTAALVFSADNSMVEMVAAALEEKGIRAGVVHGGVSDKKRNALHEEFQAGGPDSPRVIVMQTMAATALTWDAPTRDGLTAHLLDETWVPDNQEQAEGRIIPTTEELQEKRIDLGIYYYRTRGTVEEYIRTVNADKQLNNKTILDLRRKMQKALEEAEAAKVAAGE